MASRFVSKPPAWFWAAAALLLMWEALGVWSWWEHTRHGAYAMGTTPTAYDLAYFAALPPWYNGLYAAAVFTGIATGVLLFARRAAARSLALASLVLTVLMFGYTFLATDLIAAKGIWVVYFPAAIVAIGAITVWFAGLGARRGWLR